MRVVGNVFFLEEENIRHGEVNESLLLNIIHNIGRYCKWSSLRAFIQAWQAGFPRAPVPPLDDLALIADKTRQPATAA